MPDPNALMGNRPDLKHGGDNIAFHGALREVNEKYLYCLAVTDEKTFYAELYRCTNNICAMRIYEVPVKPLVFDNCG